MLPSRHPIEAERRVWWLPPGTATSQHGAVMRSTGTIMSYAFRHAAPYREHIGRACPLFPCSRVLKRLCRKHGCQHRHGSLGWLAKRPKGSDGILIKLHTVPCTPPGQKLSSGPAFIIVALSAEVCFTETAVPYQLWMGIRPVALSRLLAALVVVGLDRRFLDCVSRFGAS